VAALNPAIKVSSLTDNIRRLAGWLDYRRARALARAVVRPRLKRLQQGRILVLCYGNIYRSPFVEYYLNSIRPESLNLQVKSAGFHNTEDRRSTDAYVEYCRTWGVDLSPHRSTRVTAALLDWAELIIIMDGHNYKMVKQQGTAVTDKLIWLGALSKDTPVEISDPYAQTPARQHLVVQQLANACEALVRRISFLLI
jgi:protein-tyrosine-phosphatase